MDDTVFVDSAGAEEGNLSTAEDLFYLARYIQNSRPPIWKITKGEKVRSFGPVSFLNEEFLNRHTFFTDSSFEGGRSGYTAASNHTGIFLFRFQDNKGNVRTIASVLLGSEDPERDIRDLSAWLQKKYNLEPDGISESLVVSQ